MHSKNVTLSDLAALFEFAANVRFLAARPTSATGASQTANARRAAHSAAIQPELASVHHDRPVFGRHHGSVTAHYTATGALNRGDRSAAAWTGRSTCWVSGRSPEATPAEVDHLEGVNRMRGGRKNLDATDANARPVAGDRRSGMVAAELQTIFGPIRETVDKRRAGEVAPGVRTPIAKRRPAARLVLGLVATCLVGAAAGVIFARQSGPPPATPTAARAMLTVVPREPAAATVTPPQDLVSNADGPSVAAVMAKRLTPTGVRPPPPIRSTARVARLGDLSSDIRPPSQARPSHDECDLQTSAMPAACVFSTLMNADRRLRDAYDTAIEAGVSAPVLAAYSREWDGLRRRATRDPDLVIGNYQAMADELESYADEALESE